jgi:CheY-like chemotaxis protein
MAYTSPPTILIATDMWEFVYDYNRILTPNGIRTMPHPLNHRLLARVREHQPVAILLDFSVQERDHGLFLLDALRNDPRTAATPIIVLLDDSVAYTAVHSRAYVHVTTCLKPVSAEHLLSLVREFAPLLPLMPTRDEHRMFMEADD